MVDRACDLSSSVVHQLLASGGVSSPALNDGQRPGAYRTQEIQRDKLGWMLFWGLFCSLLYIIYDLLHDANWTGFPGAGLISEDGCWCAACLAAKPQHGWARALPQDPCNLRKGRSESMHGMQVVGGMFCNLGQKR